MLTLLPLFSLFSLSGSLCTIDICLRRLEDVGTIDVLGKSLITSELLACVIVPRLFLTSYVSIRYTIRTGTVEKIRSQRAHSIQMPDQYLFCHTAILECAAAAGLLNPADVASLDDEENSDTD